MTAPQVDHRFVNRLLSPAELVTYDEQGFLSVGRTITDEGLDEMRQECMKVCNSEKAQVNSDATWLQTSLLPNIHRHSPLVREFYFRGPLVNIAAQIIGENIKGAASQLTFKMRGNAKPFAWHQDNGYGELNPYNTLTTLTALDDADCDNGCIWLIPCSHRGGQIDVSARFTLKNKTAGDAIEVLVDEQLAVPAPMRAGETLIFHCWMLYKSEGNHSPDRDRRILFLRYADADAVEVYNGGQPRLGKLLRGRTRFDEVERWEQDLPE